MVTDDQQAELDELLGVMDIRAVGQDLFRGPYARRRLPRLFGGQALAQALIAAGRTVPDTRVPHSLHAYFIRPGDSCVPLDLAVKRLHDGGSFTVREVTVSQHGREIVHLMCSFQSPEDGPHYQDVVAPAVPRPDAAPSLEYWLDPHRAMLPDWWSTPHPFDLRFVEEPTGLTKGRVREPVQRFWMRTAGTPPNDALLHAALVTYASDLTLLDSALFPSGQSWYSDPVDGASLDHALWFHLPPRADAWLMCEQRSPISEGGRAFTTCRMTDLNANLIVSGAQEGLVRSRAGSAR
ncbi:acyl-CoA thioesterase [Streptomyces sp. OE57]|uniref:acyl-CoA thioesterase n=1 Tax=Streptomyces lacaronensis TaxID=3379885 RepID=UPI0039B78BD5